MEKAQKILELVQREFESGEQDYYCVLCVRPEELGTLDTECQNKLKNAYTTILQAIASTSVSEEQKQNLSHCRYLRIFNIPSANSTSSLNRIRHTIESGEKEAVRRTTFERSDSSYDSTGARFTESELLSAFSIEATRTGVSAIDR